MKSKRKKYAKGTGDPVPKAKRSANFKTRDDSYQSPDLGPIGFLNSYYDSPIFKQRVEGDNSTYPQSHWDVMQKVRTGQKEYKPLVIEGPTEDGKSDGSFALPGLSPDVKKMYYARYFADSTKWKNLPRQIDPRTNIILDKQQAKDYDMNLLSGVLPHEYTHTTRELSPSDMTQFMSRYGDNTAIRSRVTDPMNMYNYYLTSGLTGKIDFESYYKAIDPEAHDKLPSEQYADLNAIRYLMYKQGIYDTRKGNMTIDDFNRAKKNPKIANDFIFKRMMDNFTPEELIDLNNKVGYNKSNTSPTSAKYGAQVKTKRKSRSMYDDGTGDPIKPRRQPFMASTTGATSATQDANIMKAQAEKKGELPADQQEFLHPTTSKDIDVSGAIVAGLSTLNMFMPDRDKIKNNHPLFDFLSNYNPFPEGTGSEAIAKSGIHINPKNKGKFTASAKKAGMGVQQFAAHVLANRSDYSSTQVKRANFAHNAAGWHHAPDGVTIPKPGGAQQIPAPYAGLPEDRSMMYNLDMTNYLIAGGYSNPVGTDQGKYLLKHFGQNGGLQDGRDLLDSISLFNQSRDAQNMSVTDRIKRFYDIQSPQSSIQQFKQKIKALGEGPVGNYQKTSNLDVANQRSTASLRDGTQDPIPAGAKVVRKLPDESRWFTRNAPRYQVTYPGDSLTDNQIQMAALQMDWHHKKKGDPIYAGVYDETGKQHKYAAYPNTYGVGNPSAAGYMYYPSEKDFQKMQDYSHSLGLFSNEPGYFNINYLPPPAADTKTAKKRKGGAMAYKTGGNVPDMQVEWGGNATKISDNPYDGGTIQFNGPSHEDGGIGISYGGKGVEVEGGETGFMDPDGSLNIMGNMEIPGTNMKFKNAYKKLAKKENKSAKKIKRAKDLLENQDIFDNPFSFNTAKALYDGGDIELKNIADSKQKLSMMQRMMLAMDGGQYPVARRGYHTADTEDPGKPSVAQRHNNPGNLKYKDWMKKYGAVPGEQSTDPDKGRFAKFPDIASGQKAMRELLTLRGPGKGYKTMTVEDAIGTWTGGKPYATPLGTLKGKKVGDLDEKEVKTLLNIITQGEDQKSYNWDDKPDTSDVTPMTPVEVVAKKRPPFNLNDYHFRSTDPTTYKQATGSSQFPEVSLDHEKYLGSAADHNNLGFTQIAPEIYDIATNHVQPVQAQFDHPQLFEPYRVSFQDRLNENTANFNNVARLTQDSPTAIGSMAAQKYTADNQVLADQFRTNQQISNDVTNKNVALLNDAQKLNLQIGDQQYARQSQAQSNTRAQNRVAMSSIADKILQNNLENMRARTYESLFDYRYSDLNNDGKPDQLTYQGPDASFAYTGLPEGYKESNRVKVFRSGTGEVKQTQETIPASDEKVRDAYRNQILQQAARNSMLNLFHKR